MTDVCGDPDCPACKMGAILRELKEEGAEPEEIFPLLFAVMEEVFDITIGGSITETEEVIH